MKMDRKEAYKLIECPAMKDHLKRMYGNDMTQIGVQIKRYKKLIDYYNEKFYDEEIRLFSAPGRIEIGGNHTDHNHGRILAAAVDRDTIAAVSKTDDGLITIYSEGFSEPFCVNIHESLNPQKSEEGTTTALIRGIAAQFKELGYKIGGFHAVISSEVMVGSGLSSSGSVEVLFGSILNGLYNNHIIEPKLLALIGQYAENHYFNKPCGLMDQATAAEGGIVTIDFKNPKDPLIEKIGFDFNSTGYSVLVIDTGSNHADQIDDYASIPNEMKSVARALGGKVCRDITFSQLVQSMKDLRSKVGDRAILRAFHFLEENERVVKQVKALKQGSFEYFLDLVSESGNSSFKWLQNIYSTMDPSVQHLSLALALSEHYINQTGKGSCRVHGGGFSGTILVLMQNRFVDGYIELMTRVFGKKSVLKLKIRPVGAVELRVR